MLQCEAVHSAVARQDNDSTLMEIPLVMLNCRRRCSDFKIIWSIVEKLTCWLYNGQIWKIKAVLYYLWDIRGVPWEREKRVKCVRLSHGQSSESWQLCKVLFTSVPLISACRWGQQLSFAQQYQPRKRRYPPQGCIHLESLWGSGGRWPAWQH